MMITAGVDIGSTTVKCAVVQDGKMVAWHLMPGGPLPQETAKHVFEEALKKAGISKSDIAVIATTGYGRRLVDFGDVVMTEIKACAAGVLSVSGERAERIHTIIDVGGQDTKVIALNDEGDIEDFSMNDKCAAGTGRFLEVLAQKLNLDYERFVEEAAASDTMLQMNSTCAVFAESEVIGLLARGEKKGDIAAAAHNAIANRIASMIRRVGQRGAYCFVGGGARNKALVKAVDENINARIFIPENAQIIVALGAAIQAASRARL